MDVVSCNSEVMFTECGVWVTVNLQDPCCLSDIHNRSFSGNKKKEIDHLELINDMFLIFDFYSINIFFTVVQCVSSRLE